MRSAVAALAWEFWSANRRGWMLVLVALVACGVPFRVFAESVAGSEGMRFIAFMPLTAAIILAISFCNFTDRNRRDGIAGFPRHLFTLPVNVSLSVSCVMAFSLLSVVGIYVGWVWLVLRPIEASILIRWPATLLAAFVVFYQAIIWCLCGFRLTRVISLSLLATFLVAVGFFPTLLPQTNYWASESTLTAAIGTSMVVAYAVTLVTVGVQRRGGGRGWAGVQMLVDVVSNAIPRRRLAIKSSDAALFWIEWRRTGLVLPAAVTLMTLLILGPVLSFTGRGHKETFWAEMWLVMIPILLAFPISMGFGKPDFWSLDLSLSPFFAARPVSDGQLLAAKLKAAACSTLLAWAILLVVAPTYIYWYCDTKHWGHLWDQWQMVYFPFSQWAIPILAVVGAILVTWSVLVRTIWLGYSGNAAFYYSLTSAGLIAFMAGLFCFVWWQDHPRTHGDSIAGMLPWIPWVLAVVVTAKVWLTASCVQLLLRRRLVSERNVAMFTGVWISATAFLVLGAWLFGARIEWFRNIAMLVGLCAIPAASIVAAPLSIAWNRHR